MAAPAAPVAAPVVPKALAPIFRPLTVSGSSELPVSSSAPFPPPFAAPGAVPDFASAAPPQPPQPLVSAAPLASTYVGSAEDHFDPGYPDAVPRDLEVPLPQSLPTPSGWSSVVCYAYLVDLFPQAEGGAPVEPPPRTLRSSLLRPLLLSN